MAEKLTDVRVQAMMEAIPEWRREGDSISRTFVLLSFPAALIFAGAVGHLAEAADHHPDILIQWKKVTLTLSTHEAGGLTLKDFDLAKQIDGLPSKQ